MHYASSASIGYRFRPSLILIATKDEKLGQPESVDLGDGMQRPVRLLASRTGIGGRVSLLAIEGIGGPSLDDDSASEVLSERPIDFTEAVALRADEGGAVAGYILSFQGSDRRMDFITAEEPELTIGSPVFIGDRFIGIVARNRSPPEQWLVTPIRLAELFFDTERRQAIETATGKQLGEQFLALVRSFKAHVTRLWSLYELVESPEFKLHLVRSEVGPTSAPAEGKAPIQDNGSAREFNAAAGALRDRAAQFADAVLHEAPEGVWTPLGRPPRQFPLAPAVPVAWAIVLLLLLLSGAGILAVLGTPSQLQPDTKPPVEQLKGAG
ncbi:hypothetical protein BRADO3215 [Bradyrhizobium sp. ORS 278]|nr:hypothetical protein BRADO3215 [Bradyrhizobium sp. ORS 278]